MITPGPLLEEVERVGSLEDEIDPRDIDGNPIRIGEAVQYAHDRDGVWNQERWGIVTGIHGRYETIRVTPVQVMNDHTGWKNTEWFAKYDDLRVIS